MYFIGMLAFNTPFNVDYDLALTLLSMVIAIVVVVIGLAIVGRGILGTAGLFIGGTIAGLGVSAMYYTGMAAMRMPATIIYNHDIVILSVIIGVVAATEALWLAFNLRGFWQRFGSAFIMGIAVCGMHYTGMFAVSMQIQEQGYVSESAISTSELAIAIFLVTLMLLTSLLFFSHLKTRAMSVD